MSEASQLLPDPEVRSVSIPLRSTNLLLPNASVAELIDYRPLDRLDGTADWMLGATSWRQRSLLVIDFERLIGVPGDEESGRRRIVVCHVLNKQAGRPFVGILAQAIPRLIRVREGDISVEAAEGDAQLPIRARLSLAGQQAVVPDLPRVGELMTGEI